MTTIAIVKQQPTKASQRETPSIEGVYQCKKGVEIEVARFNDHDTSTHVAFICTKPVGMSADRWERMARAIGRAIEGFVDARAEVSDIDYRADQYSEVSILYIDTPRKWEAANHFHDEVREIISLAARFFVLGCE